MASLVRNRELGTLASSSYLPSLWRYRELLLLPGDAVSRRRVANSHRPCPAGEPVARPGRAPPSTPSEIRTNDTPTCLRRRKATKRDTRDEVGLSEMVKIARGCRWRPWQPWQPWSKLDHRPLIPILVEQSLSVGLEPGR